MLSLTLIYSKQDTWKRSLTVARTTRRHSPGALPAWICHTAALAVPTEQPFRSFSIEAPGCSTGGLEPPASGRQTPLNRIGCPGPSVFPFPPPSVFRDKKQTALTLKLGNAPKQLQRSKMLPPQPTHPHTSTHPHPLHLMLAMFTE